MSVQLATGIFVVFVAGIIAAGDLKCDKDSEYVNRCGSICEGTCANPVATCRGTCPGPPACVCKVDYLRNGEGKCVFHEFCNSYENKTAIDEDVISSAEEILNSLNCSENEYKNECGNKYESNCKDVLGQFRTCATICYLPACSCKDEGFARNSDGICVRIRDCPRNDLEGQCDMQKEFVNMCGNHCEGTCEQPKRPCARGCKGSPKCTCNQTKGYVRHENGMCVLLKYCQGEKDNLTKEEANDQNENLQRQ